MPSPRRAARRALAGTAGLAVAVSGLAAFAVSPASANPAGTALVISEVYGGGGNSGATLRNDFIELYNPTAAAISVDGMSVQYRSSSSTSAASGVTNLTGSVPAGGHYLVQQAPGAGGTVDLPPADATGSIAMSGTAFTVWLAEGTTALNPPADNAVGTPGVVDLVGVNSNTFETARAAAASNSTSLARVGAGTDTDNNAADFTVGSPTPTPTGGTPDPEPGPDPVARTIPEIQGGGEVSPFVGTSVITSGVVTAEYETGGFNGFYLQTPGTGGASDPAGRTASDAVFVYLGMSGADRTSVFGHVEPGQHLQVTGEVGEYAGATQVTVAAPSDVEALTTPAARPRPLTGTWPATDAQKERMEGMLFMPEGRFTVTDTFATNTFGEVGLAKGDTPLVQPTEVARPGSPEAAAVAADNAARGIVLDDGASTSFASSTNFTPTNGHLTPAYVSNTEPVRVGAATAFTAPVILTEGGSPSAPTYRFQPTEQVVGPENAASPATFENTRTAAPDEALLNAEGTADVKVASFNVLNYFTTLGDPNDDNVGDGGCLAFNDADGDGNTVRTGCDPRGAWDPEDLARQQEKIVAAINALDADVIGLMEIENSAALGETADEATTTLVSALNAAAGARVWAANPSSADLPPAAEQDVISNAIIYRTDAVARVGESHALGELSGDDEAFGNAREPIAQAFRSVDGGEAVLVVVNHFKSKGSAGPWPGDADQGDGQGAGNVSRTLQAEALRDWVPALQAETGVDATLLIGDFNSYSMEDPLQVLYEAGYTNVEQHSGNGEHSYSFGGLVGSLDHVLANDAAMDSYTGVDIWNINSPESIALEYSRWNYHSTDFHTPTPYRSSDHDPVIMGLDLVDDPEPVTATVKVRHTPKKVRAGKTRATLHIRVKAAGGHATGKVTVKVAGAKKVTVRLRGGKATVRLPKFDRPGKKVVTVRYLGNDEVGARTVTHTIHVVKQRKG